MSLLPSQNKYKLVKLKKKQENILLRWRNEKITRLTSLNKNIVSIAQHKNWLKKIKKNKLNQVFIFYNNNIPIGTSAAVRKENNYFLNYSIDKNYREKGLAIKMLNLLLKRISNKIDSKFFYAKVLKNNKKSLYMLKKIGFYKFNIKNDLIIMKYNLVNN